MAEFLAMGGYAFYVWGAYAATGLVLLACAVAPWWHHRRLRRSAGSKMPDPL